jgi:NADPH:quinone reductase-like Zn-dependent oxidoreductase
MKTKTTKAVVLPAYNDNLLRAIISLKIEEREIRPLKENEVLVKMEAAPCNPSDIAFLRGGYNIKKTLPAVPGFEGTGLVVEAGAVAKSLIGERVSCFVQEGSDGTWAEFFIARKQDCIVLKENMPVGQATCFAINPLTAFGMFEMVKQTNAKAIIVNAAGGQVPNILRAFANRDGIQVVNIVRKETQLRELAQKGEAWVLDSSDENFQNNLKAICKKMRPSIAFDAVGGEMTAQLFNAMPGQSQVVVYGGLSGNTISGIDAMEVIFKGKKLLGFNLNDWIDAKSSDEFFTLTNKLQDMFISGELKTEIQASVPLDDIVKGIRIYIKSMSGGKVLFIP